MVAPVPHPSRRSIFICSKDVNKLLIFEAVNWKLDLLVPSLLLFFALTRRLPRLLPILLCCCCKDFSHSYPNGREYFLKQPAFSLLDNALWIKQVWSFCFTEPCFKPRGPVKRRCNFFKIFFYLLVSLPTGNLLFIDRLVSSDSTGKLSNYSRIFRLLEKRVIFTWSRSRKILLISKCLV